jgi:predicted nucleic acid-binding protein
MKLIIDTNRIIAAIIVEGTSRKILFNERFEFYAPKLLIKEILKHKKEIIKKSKKTELDFNYLFSKVLEQIKIIKESKIEIYLNHCKKLIEDPEDIPFLASAMAIKAEGIWTEDKDFQKQIKIKIFSNKDLLNLT